MLRDDSLPTPYHHKMPMQFKNYDIFYNRDYNLGKIVPNQHNYYEFYFLISGNVTYYIEGRKYTLESGDILLISPNQKHWAFIDDSASVPYERYVLWLSLGYVDSLSSDRTRLSYIFQTSYIISQQIRLSGCLLYTSQEGGSGPHHHQISCPRGQGAGNRPDPRGRTLRPPRPALLKPAMRLRLL